MNRATFLSALLVTCVAASCGPLSAFAAETWKAGSAKANITPEKYMWMAGYGGRDKPAEGKLTDLWAKALALEDANGRRAVLITLDLVGIDRGLSTAVCGKLKEKYKLDREQIAICVSHTHTGPVVARNLRPMHYLLLDESQQKLIDEYANFLEARIVAVVGEALNRLEPSALSWGSGQATFAVNRRNNPEPKVPELKAEGKLRGPVDHDVPVLAVRSAAGKLKTVVFGYACHATVLSFFQWSGDYPAFAQMELEKAHPDCLALFWAGCGADQNPLPRRTVELAQGYGKQLAESVEAVLAKELVAVTPELQTSYREIPLPLGKLPTLEEITASAASADKFVAARAKMFLTDIEAGRSLAQTYPYPVGLWRLGKDVRFVILGGEVVVDYATRIKSELSGTKTWVAGYANDVMAYIPSRRVLTEGGYEGAGAMVYYGLPTSWAPEVEELIVAEVLRQAKEAK